MENDKNSQIIKTRIIKMLKKFNLTKKNKLNAIIDLEHNYVIKVCKHKI